MEIRQKMKITILIILFLTTSIYYLFFNYKTEKALFRIYYRSIDETILAEMANYDLNIVESAFFTRENVDFLHNKNSKLLGYISLIEIGSWDNSIINKLTNDDFLRDNNNEILYSLDKVNPLGDLSSSHFREILFERIEEIILTKKMDGLFLDTLDWIDYYKDDIELYNKLLSGYKEFLIELKRDYPSIIIMQNRGLESYFNFSKSYITSILWENFDYSTIESKKNKNKDFMKFKLYVKMYKTNVYLISFINDDKNRKIASELYWNYLYSQMKNRYSKWNIMIK